uniref:androglobin isoform X2 n=1 Tax=Pristiophorus japonicus TaxID=55135 RepID=UPI00398E3939
MSKGARKRDSMLKASPSPVHVPVKDTTSFVLSCGGTGALTESRKGRFPLWPEWNEADVNVEKWDTVKTVKEKEKSPKSPSLLLFEDPEGKIELPPSLKVHSWKRPHEIFTEKLMRWIISEIIMLWVTCQSTDLNEKTLLEATGPPWKPWEHIYALCKATKVHQPLYNSYGKYVVRLYWMGCWRKITLDDTMPFDKNDNLLLPSTTNWAELWPMLLSKALIKVANIDMNMSGRKELGDFTVLHALTGWLPEIIPIRSEESERIWSFLKTMVPEFSVVTKEHVADIVVFEDSVEKNKENEGKLDSASIKPTDKVTKEKTELKDTGKKKNKEGENIKDKSKPAIQRQSGNVSRNASQSFIETIPTPVQPEVMIYATYFPLQLSERKISLLGKMAQSSERLRHYGLSHIYSHPVQVTRTRCCPLVKPPESSQVPRWKLIRPRIRTIPIADPKEPKVKKPDQFVEISSPFLNYKIDTTAMPPLKSEHQLLINKATTSSLAAVSEKEETLDESEDADQNIKHLEQLSFAEDSQMEVMKLNDQVSLAAHLNNHPLGNNIDTKKETPSESIKSVAQFSSASHGAKSRQGSGRSRLSSASENKKESRSESIKSAGQISTPSQGSKSRYDSAVDLNKDDTVNVQHQLESLMEGSNDSTPIVSQHVSLMSGLILNLDLTSDISTTVEQKNFCVEEWIDAEDFYKCFQTLIIFHNPSKYSNTFQKSNLKPTDDRGPYYLYVDNVKPTEILVTFSALVRWGDINCERFLSKESNDKDNLKAFSGLQPGILLAEPYSWKSLVSSSPILYIKTLATKSTTLELPGGRHVIRFTASSPLGHSITVSGTVPFVFGDEEAVLANLSKESTRFIQKAVSIMKAIENMIHSFGDQQEFHNASMELELALQFQDKNMADEQKEVFNNALYATLIHSFDVCLSPEENFAIRSLIFDTSPRKLFRKGKTCSDAVSEVPEGWQDRSPTKEEGEAATKLQAWWKTLFIREIMRARTAGTEQNATVKEILRGIWEMLEPEAFQHGLFLLRYMFDTNPKLAERYPFYEDEWSRTVYDDYTSTYSDHHPHFWFVVFREVFHMPEDMLIVPKIYSALPVSVLHVINNDTGEEIPRVFQKVPPHVYAANKNGYTFTVEAETGNTIVPSGKWRMRLIGSRHPLPVLGCDAVNSNFSMKEIKSYYVPNDKDILFRFQLNVNANHLTTLHVQTSKPDVYIKLQILDQEKEVARATGKGHAIIPSYLIRKTVGRTIHQVSTSKLSATPAVGVGTKKLGSTSSSSSKAARGSAKAGNEHKALALKHEASSSLIPFIEEKPSPGEVPHKYIIQALVLHKSWPLTENELNFADSQKDMDNEIAERSIDAVSPENEELKPPIPKHSKKGRDKAADKSDKGKEKLTPAKREIPMQQIDLTRPHFTVHYVTDYGEGDSIEIKKDTEQQDEIRAMKSAWEAAEPGRAFKALQLRLHTLNYKQSNNSLPSAGEKEGENVTEDGSEVDGHVATALEEPPTDNSQDGKETQPIAVGRISEDSDHLVAEMKWTHYLRTTRPEPILHDERIIEEQEKSKAEEIHKFRQRRDIVLEQRGRERQARRQLKAQQLQMYEDLQTALDEARQGIYQLRESYRNKLIEEELKKQKEIAAIEADVRVEPERKSLKTSAKQFKSGRRK